MDINLLGENGALPICRLVSSDLNGNPVSIGGISVEAQCDIPSRIMSD